MASRIIHYAISKMTADFKKPQDLDRFIFGAMLPDAHIANDKSISHLKLSVPPLRTYDLDAFRKIFKNELLTDDLYRGYYLHLIQDIYFRDFMYNKHHWSAAPYGNIAKLHRDYTCLNSYIIEKYSLKNTLTVPNSFDGERIKSICQFDTKKLLVDLEQDFESVSDGIPILFTPEMADDYIAIAAEHSALELVALDKGAFHTDMYKMAWS